MTTFDPTSPDDLAKLREIAGRATPGPWETYADPGGPREASFVAVEAGETEVRIARFEGGHFDGLHIATFDPPTVTVLLDALTTAPEERDKEADSNGWMRSNLRCLTDRVQDAELLLTEAEDRADHAEAALQRVRDVIAETVAIHHRDGIPDDGMPDCICCQIQQTLDGA